MRTATGGARKRIRVNGVARRAAGAGRRAPDRLFAPEEMLLVAGSPSLRREALDRLAGQRSPAYARDLATYGRALQQRNGLLRRDPRGAGDAATSCAFWDATLLESGAAVREERARLLDGAGGAAGRRPRARSPRTRRPPSGCGSTYATNAPQLPGESARDALARRLAETAEKEVWNGTTLIGPHRDDLVFEMGGRPLASFASRGQQRTAILAFKLAELDLLTALDGRPPLLLLDDVFSRARPGAARPPRAADRGAAAGVRDDDHARRPRPGAAPRRHHLGGDGRTRTGVSRLERRRLDVRRPRVAAPGAAGPRRGSATCCRTPPGGLGLEDELRLARAIATWDALVAERVPPAVGACRLVALEPRRVVVAVDEPIVAAELRMRALELLGAFAAAPGGRVTALAAILRRAASGRWERAGCGWSRAPEGPEPPRGV